MRDRVYHDPVERRYYARFRDMPLADDLTHTVSALTTRYYSGIGTRPCLGPRGGKNHSQCFYRYTYYWDGRFWEHENVLADDYSDVLMDDYERFDYDYNQERHINHCVFVNALTPYTGTLYDKVPLQSMEKGIPVVCIKCENGYPVSVRKGQDVIWDGDSPWSDMAHLLGLDKKKRKSPKAA